MTSPRLERPQRRTLGLVCAAACLGLPALAQAGGRAPVPVLNPTRYASPSGTFTLDVDPSDRYGRGPARYELRRDGTVVWSGERPYTLYEAAVADDGTSAGYAYTQGIEGFARSGGRKAGCGQFIVVILDPAGRERLHESTERQESRVLHTDPDPKAAGFFLDPANDRVVFRVEDANRGSESWWSYRLSTGGFLSRDEPEHRIREPDSTRSSMLDARPVAGTGLILIHWWRYEYRREGGRVGARFTLADRRGETVWTLELPDDYRIDGDRAAEDRLRREILTRGAILDVSRARRFTVRFARDGQGVTFAVVRDDGAPRGWTVTEEARRPFAPPSEADAAEPRAPARTLEPLGTLELGGPPGPKPAVRAVREFDFDERGRIGFIRREDDALAFVLVGQDGRVAREVPLGVVLAGAEDAEEARGTNVSATWLQGDRWLVWATPGGIEARSRAWRLDGASGGLAPLDGFDCPAIEGADNFPDGGFAVVARHRFRNTSESEVIAFDGEGTRRFGVRKDPVHPNWQYSRDAVAVTTLGEVCALGTVERDVHVFDREGRFLKAIDLEAAWGRKPNYTARLAADGEGGLLVEDFRGSSPVVWMDSAWRVKAEFPPPRLADGNLVELRHFQISPDARLWISDGASILRLSAAGVVDRALGQPPSADAADGFVSPALDREGRLHAVEPRTGAVHVFAADGSRLRVLKPIPEDVSAPLWGFTVTVGDDGTVLVGGEGFAAEGRGTGYVVFSADGTRLGRRTFDLDSIHERCHARPGSDQLWVATYHAVHLVGGDGVPSRTIERKSDRTWLDIVKEVSVAPDGSIAVAASPSVRKGAGDDPGYTVSIYDPHGDAVRSFPVGVGRWLWGIAYDGRRVVVAGDSGVVVLTAEGEPIAGLTPAATDLAGKPFACLLPAGGRELWLLPRRGRTVHRFAMP